MAAITVDDVAEGECEFDFGAARRNHHCVAFCNHIAEFVGHGVAYVVVAHHFGVVRK